MCQATGQVCSLQQGFFLLEYIFDWIVNWNIPLKGREGDGEGLFPQAYLLFYTLTKLRVSLYCIESDESYKVEFQEYRLLHAGVSLR